MRLLSIVVLAGCGRIAFDPIGGDGGGHGDGSSSLPDATTACIADGFCPLGCGAADPDCQTVCGDTQCVGNAGETCQSCATDCRTTANMCGNGACGPGEDGTTCFFDCGPAPWTWDADETALLAAVNNARTSGTSCGGGPVTTAPAVTFDPGLHAAARDLAWELAHLASTSPNRCNGQSLISYSISVNASGTSIRTSAPTTQARVTEMLGTSSPCSIVMNSSHSLVGVGIAVDQATPFVLLFR